MWYAVQVMNGREEKVVLQCNKLIEKEILQECFLPKTEKMKKYKGQWHKEQALLFPGYVFMVSDMPEELRLALRRIPELTKLLGDAAYPSALYHEEVEFLLRFGEREHIVAMSQGYMEGDEVVVVSGPMRGYEGQIKRINRHKRMAVLNVHFFGRDMDVKVGLEIIDRRPEKGEGEKSDAPLKEKEGEEE